DNNASVHYSNWAPESPSNSAAKACVQMTSDGASKGKWTDQPCDKMNRVVCEKVPNISIGQLHQSLLDARKEFRDSLIEQKNQFLNSETKLQQEIVNLKQNPIPLGFIYVQLSNQPEPKTLWPE